MDYQDLQKYHSDFKMSDKLKCFFYEQRGSFSSCLGSENLTKTLYRNRIKQWLFKGNFIKIKGAKIDKQNANMSVLQEFI